jgi:hypothetical protein
MIIQKLYRQTYDVHTNLGLNGRPLYGPLKPQTEKWRYIACGAVDVYAGFNMLWLLWLIVESA